MSILQWDKPPKVRSTEEHNKMYSSSADAPGTYVPNMTASDQNSWKAKHVGGDDPRVEIRKSVDYVNVVLHVRLNRRKSTMKYHEHQLNGHVSMSLNGTGQFSSIEWDEMVEAVQEAKEFLKSKENL